MKELILKWNNLLRYDFWWRDKYNVAFNSEQHRAMNPIDVKFDWLEKRIAEQQQLQYHEAEKQQLQYLKDGKWLKPRTENSKEEQQILDELDLSKIRLQE